ncbi:hypothetical protein Ddye_023055 [Dipteronia dyeriana]|uniref:Retrotransposon Copia-like N-terminal domain-containing protein n=1 Tax=Dipteronia dyeriana TaxID=168575 RepID=A0AAD9TSQ1_9ROSI|nr:hypothetical protein Ddye_023055 [Dipteronia dyeriana]
MAIMTNTLISHEEENQDASSSSSKASEFASLAKAFKLNLQVKLDNENYISWKAQVIPIIKAFELEDFISGLKPTPPKFVEIASVDGGDKQLVLNKEYSYGKKSDQLLLSWLFSSISQTIIGQVTDCSSSFEV